MKKIKTFALLLICLFASTIFFACNKTIHVKSIQLSETEIVLRPNESKDISVSLEPVNATNKNFKFILTDDEFVSVVQDNEDCTKAKVIAKEGLVGTFTTFLQVESEDQKLRSDLCKITIYTDKTKLFAPQNLDYDADNQLIVWDKIDSASGYKLKINIEGEIESPEIICSTNSYKIDEYFNKIISVQVKSLGDDVVYLDSDFGEKTFKFMQLEEPKNLTNDGNFVKFDKVNNAKEYEIYVFENSIETEPKYNRTVSDENFDSEIVCEIAELQTPGKQFFVKVRAKAFSLDEVTVYQSKSENYIEVNKIATPLVNNSNLKFTYNTNTISWNANPNASGYKLRRYKSGVIDKEYIFDNENLNVNHLVLDTSGDKLVAGKYSYTLTILGNGKNYLDSNESDGLIVEKLSAPQIFVQDGEVVWNRIENIGGYKFVIVGKLEENLSTEQTNFSLDSTLSKPFEAGTYQFKIASLGNGTNTITSDFSSVYSFDKLDRPETPTLSGNQYLTFRTLNEVQILNVSLTHYNANGSVDFIQEKEINNFATTSTNKIATIDMLNDVYKNSLYPQGLYKVYVKGYAQNLIKSEPSETFEFTKLANTQTVSIEKGEISYSKPENVNIVEVLLNDIVVYSDIPENFDINSISGFEAGREYNIQLRYYPQTNTNFVISNKTEKVYFEKILASTNLLSVQNGEILVQSSVTGTTVFEVKTSSSDVITKYYNLDQIKFEENNSYSIKMYFEGNDYRLNSDYSNEITVELMKAISDLSYNNGKISFTSNDAQTYKAIIKSGSIKKTVENISSLASYSEIENETTKISFELKDLISAILPIEYDNLGDNLEIYIETIGCKTNKADRQKYSTLSNNSNSIFVQYQKAREIIDLEVSEDNLEFKTCNAENYYAKLTLSGNEQTINLSTLTSFEINDNVNGTATFSINELIKKAYPDSYGSLEDIVEIYILCDGLNSKFEIKNDIVIFKTVDRSESVYLNILNNPTSLRASKLLDLVTDPTMISENNIGLNKLYFDCNEKVNMFEFNYTNSLNVTKTKILTLSNYLSLYKTSNGINTYQINTSFLDADKYSFTLKSLRETKGEMNQNLNSYVYNYDSYSYVELADVTKLSMPSSIECVDGKIVINDESSSPSGCSNAYLLTINGKVIYDDVLGEGNDINDVLNTVSLDNPSSILSALTLINQFTVKERVLPSAYCGTFEVSVLKIVIPQGMNLTGGVAIQADTLQPITVTRLETIKPQIINGIIEWNSIKDAEVYSLYKTKVENGKKVVDLDNLITTKNSDDELKFDIYNYLNGQAGSYSYVMIARTTKDNYLSSLTSSLIEFEILATPDIYVENGKVVWNAVNNTAGYKLDVYKEGVYFDSLILNKSVLSYDAMMSSKNKALDSANYEFRITALGEIQKNDLNEFKDETTVIKSLTTEENTCSAFKLQTPQKVYVEDGMLVLSQVNSNNGVNYYNLLINQKATTIDKTKLKFDLGVSYKAGVYNLLYQAVGGNTTLTSNFSDDFDAEKLPATSEIYMLGGELFWNNVSAENYENGLSAVKYNFSLNKENSVYSQQTLATTFEISKQDAVSFGLYTFEVKVLGDNYYYLNSDSAYLNNVVKLAEIKDIRVENGILTWTNPRPSDIVGLPANSKASPNGYKLIINKDDYNKKEYKIEDGTNQFVLGEDYAFGEYNLTIQNIGNAEQSSDYNYSNSKIVSGKVYKLMSPTELNISDGINLKWKNPNTKLVQNYIVNIKCTNDDVIDYYSGVIYSSTKSIRFEDICYYENANGEKVLILSTNSSIITDAQGNMSFNGFSVNKFNGEGEIEVYIRAYGDSEFINSEKSNTLNIIRPKEITNLKIEHGLVSWDNSEDANGYILSLTRYTLNESQEKVFDDEYGENYNLVYVNKNSYNLTDVNYYYNVTVRAYSLVTSGDNQTMASKPVSYENFLFNSFTDGNGSKLNPYMITSENTLALIKYNNVAFYKLANNINLTKNWTSLFTKSRPFAGNLDGDGKTISNLTIYEKYTYSGLLGYVGKDTISDDRVVNGERIQFIDEQNQLRVGRVENIDFNTSTISAGFNVGIICGLNEGEIYNINIRNASVVSSSEELVDTDASYRSIYSGLVTGVNNGKIEKVSVQTDNTASRVEPQAKTTLYSGGICATNNGEIVYCYVKADVYGTVAGGICAINNKNIDFCAVYGTVTCENYVSNKATLIARAGGISAYNNENARISNVIVENDLFGTTSHVGISNISTTNVPNEIVYVGGLVGENKGECFNAFVRIDIFNKSENGVDCVLGYLFGYNTNNTVNNCKFVLSAETDAVQISGDTISINSSNCQVSNHSQNMIDEFNAYNAEKQITNYEWNYIEYYEFNESIRMNIDIGFIKI